jgi:hypothetical protein
MKIQLKPNNVPKEPGRYIGGSGLGYIMVDVISFAGNPALYIKVAGQSQFPLENCAPNTQWSDKLEFTTTDVEGETLRRNLLTADNALEEGRGILYTRFNLEAIAEAAKRKGLGKLAHAASRAATVIAEYT